MLDEACRKNLEALVELRDTAVHFYHHTPCLVRRIHEVATATVKNFVSAVQDWLEDQDLSQFDFYPMPLSFIDLPHTLEGVTLNKFEKKWVEYLQQIRKGHDDATARYTVTVNIELQFVRSKAASGAPVRVTKDPKAPAVRLTEEDLRKRYPWTYQDLMNQCRNRYADFKINNLFHELRKNLVRNPKYAYVRRLDPNKGEPKRIFYSSSILDEFDQHYRQRKE